MEQTKEKGFYFQLTDDQLCEINQPTHFKDFMIERIEKANPLLTPEKALKRYRYELSVESQQLERLKIVWFGDAPTLDQSLSDIITPHIANISFHTHAYKVNLDNF